MEAPAIPNSFRFSTILPTRWVDGDVQGVLNNAVYSTLLEEGRYAYFGHLGLIEEGHFPFLLAQTNISFRSPGYGGRRVQVELATTRLGRSSFEQSYRIREVVGANREVDERVWCEAQARLVCYHAGTGKSQPMADNFRAAIESFEGLGSTG
ncbi:MAG: acyl-CoA thioesterase FadM [Planctomycetota bacterium]|jgi:acyl-CoA thioesterase FadM